MPLFHYKSVAESGDVVEGQLEASDQAAVIGRLQRLGQVPLKVEAAGGRTVLPVTEIPGAVTMAIFEDPSGNKVGLVKA